MSIKPGDLTLDEVRQMFRSLERAYRPDGAATVAEKEERRAVHEAIELRADDASATISGYAAVFNQETVIGGSLWGFREQIAPEAFDEAIKTDDVRALFNHDPNYLLGRTESGTLRLKADKKGLRYEVDLPDTAQAKDVRTLIARGDVSGSSFGFIVEEDEWDEREVKKGKLPLRTIRKAALFDVSPVTYPAYPQTSVSARSKAEASVEAEKLRAEQVEAAKTPDLKALDAMVATLAERKAWQG
jgi:HK97 family phage prohead protease